LRIDEKGLTVNAPTRVSQRFLNEFLFQKSGWIVQKLKEFHQRRIPSMQWCHGEALPYLGSSLRLSLMPWAGRSKVTVDGECLWVWLADPLDPVKVEDIVVKWYRRQALDHLTVRLAIYAQQIGVQVPKLTLSGAKTRWGSCNARGEIRLNWRLIKAPQDQIDYVVAHELAHLSEMNHSPAFWRTVSRIFPDYARVKQELRVQSPLYGLF